MNWFRSNLRLGSRLALFALATQFLLSFGHFHGRHAGAALALAEASDSASPARASGAAQPKTSSDDEPNGQAADHCAICAVMVLANTMLAATPPGLIEPQTEVFLYLTADAEFVYPNSASVAFQPRAPPIS